MADEPNQDAEQPAAVALGTPLPTPTRPLVAEEDLLFWNAVQMLQGKTPDAPRPEAPSPTASKRAKYVSSKGNRCGECVACSRDDCGACLNCLDKPKFGGRGARKQACVMRLCSKPWLAHEQEEDPSESDETLSAAEASPGLQPQPLPLPPPARLPEPAAPPMPPSAEPPHLLPPLPRAAATAPPGEQQPEMQRAVPLAALQAAQEAAAREARASDLQRTAAAAAAAEAIARAVANAALRATAEAAAKAAVEAEARAAETKRRWSAVFLPQPTYPTRFDAAERKEPRSLQLTPQSLAMLSTPAPAPDPAQKACHPLVHSLVNSLFSPPLKPVGTFTDGLKQGLLLDAHSSGAACGGSAEGVMAPLELPGSCGTPPGLGACTEEFLLQEKKMLEREMLLRERKRVAASRRSALDETE